MTGVAVSILHSADYDPNILGMNINTGTRKKSYRRGFDHRDAALIEAIGGTSAVARECEVTHSAVSQWKTQGIPLPWWKYLRLRFPEEFEAVGHGADPDSNSNQASTAT
ncbi:hypothetical protein DUW70_01910 [Stenotrophomonas maltophilia]|nr:hypothetical protein DUW70_01910 [Stenotrophomonas maltophilia]